MFDYWIAGILYNAHMVHPPADLMAKIRTLDERMSDMLSGDDRFTLALWLYCLYNPDIGAADLTKTVVESLEGGNFPSLKGIHS